LPGLEKRRRAAPVVVHFVQHVAHPPVELEEWPDGDRRSRLVFVTRGLPREPVAQLFAGVAAIAVSGAENPLARHKLTAGSR
jgi:G3E family GTPase